jgi:hypothetical protein
MTRMQKRRVRWQSGGLAVVALGSAAALTVWMHGAPPAPPARALPASTSAIAQRGATSAAVPVHAAAPAAATAELPLQAQVDRLLATRNPADALNAFYLVTDCVTFNSEHDRMVYDEEEIKHWKGDTLPGWRGMNAAEKRQATQLCGALTAREGERRFDYLAIAMRAGVPGAVVAFVNAGPFGDPTALNTRPDDPLVRAWKTQATEQLALSAESGDLDTLGYLASENLGGPDLRAKDWATIYRYRLAQGLIYADRFGPNNHMATMYAVDGELTKTLGASLSPEQAAAELVAAQRIAFNEKATRTHRAASAQ